MTAALRRRVVAGIGLACMAIGSVAATEPVRAAPGDPVAPVTPVAPVAPVETIDDSATICCAPAERLDPPVAPRDTIAIVGDSLTVGVTRSLILGSETLQNRINARGQQTTLVSAESGRTMREGTAVIQSNRAAIRDADVVFVALGTNNLFGIAGSTVAGAISEIQRINTAVLEIDPSTTIVWLDVSVESVARRTANFNDGLDAVVSTAQNIEICQWRDQALSTPGTFARDRIHLTTSGYRARRDIILDCLGT